MPTKSTTKKPPFQTEEEEAEWYHSTAGREQAKSAVQKAIRSGKIIIDEQLSPREAAALAKRTGQRVILRKGSHVKRTDPAVLQQLFEEARGAITQAVSLRIPVNDLEAAKRIAEKKGIGYQTVLKEIIHKGLGPAA
jgi:sugar/nucleoside kinase (ribokinase family)